MDLTVHLDTLLAGDKIDFPEELKRQDGGTAIRSTRFHEIVTQKQHFLVIWNAEWHQEQA